MKRLTAAVGSLLMLPALASAQNTDHQYRGQGYFFVGFGTGTASYNSPLIVQVGGGAEGFLYKGVGFGAEAAYVSWGGNYNAAVTASGDFSYHFGRHARRGRLDPFMLEGLSFVGPTEKGGGRGSLAGNFGGGTNLWIADHAALRFEFRDIFGASFWEFDHVIAFRVGVTLR